MLICMIVLPTLPGCGADREAARLDAFRAALSDASVTVTAEVSVRDGDDVAVFTLRCAETAEGCEIEVLAPEEIAGVRAHLAEGETALQFEDLILPMPQTPNTVSPLRALPLLLQAVRTGYVDLVWQEDGLAAQLIADDDTAVRLYFDDTDTPAAAEIDAGGHTNVFCTITGWTTEKRTPNESNDPNVGGDQS